MKNNVYYVIVALLAVVIVFSIAGIMKQDDGTGTDFKPVFQKGMNYVSWQEDRYLTPGSDAALKALADTGTEWVSLVTTWYQVDCSKTEIFPTEMTPSDTALLHAIETIHNLGMKVMLKPQLDILDTSGGAWRGEIFCVTDEKWEDWFKSYAEFILYYAELAQSAGVDIFCVGTELSTVSNAKREWWKTMIIAPVRRAYKGPITYAANWDGEYRNVVFWDLLDYVGIDAYFPLAETKKPAFDEITEGWKPWFKDIEDFQAKVSMPIIFPEVGYCSASGAAMEPWVEIMAGRPDIQQQADCYEALFRTYWDKPWFYGVYWWRWGTTVRSGGPNNKSFPPQNKKAEKILRQWYGEPTPRRDPSIFKKKD
ncbi:MAG: hypothetical protein ABIJ27_01705 [Candidatus Omnitrophota bacterium]